MPEHDMKKMTEEFLKFTEVKIEIMRFHRSKNVIDEYNVYICLLWKQRNGCKILHLI